MPAPRDGICESKMPTTKKLATKRPARKAAKKRAMVKKRVVLKPAKKSALSDFLKKYFGV